ncbi:glycosyltransferase family 2 protein [Flavobacterium notoginsengisoli]|uniref:glycosyltransferase family 2 protein n=1 Tax=Flavobacterium notoginsengisoli TaxID=1478199 RepID=UPI003637EF2F
MVIVYHQNNKVTEIDYHGESKSFLQKNIARTLFETAADHSDSLIIWCHIKLKTKLNPEYFYEIFHHHKIMVSYNPEERSFLSDAIGYVEDSPFLKINKKTSYPTWLMSSAVGGVHASVLNILKDEIKKDQNFDYFLQSFAKQAMPIGLFCYSEPKLLKDSSEIILNNTSSSFFLFRFVKQHYKTRWIFLLFLNLFLYERKFLLSPLFGSFFYSKRKLPKKLLDKIQVRSTNKTVEKGTIDVIIPTIGRKEFLYDVLRDLSAQTLLPKNVIIIEQNPNQQSVSELDYLNNESWPFNIKHTFTRQAGVCNARNLALKEVESEWVFLNDDDNRFSSDLLEKVLEKASFYGINCLTTSYLQGKEILKYNAIHQSGIFGSGNSFLKADFLNFVSFNKSLEFGYGEDTDFGLQLRNLGVDIIYFPELSILHLKAPIGGFRNKFISSWEVEGDSPKPSPNIMYVKSKYSTIQQLLGYKTVLFFKFYKGNLFDIPKFNDSWQLSVKWSKRI